MTVKDVSEYLSVSPSTVYTWANKGIKSAKPKCRKFDSTTYNPGSCVAEVIKGPSTDTNTVNILGRNPNNANGHEAPHPNRWWVLHDTSPGLAKDSGS